jgi:hypothetical protein
MQWTLAPVHDATDEGDRKLRTLLLPVGFLLPLLELAFAVNRISAGHEVDTG